MDVKFCSRLFAIACVVALLSSALVAQTTTQIAGDVPTTTSISTATFATPDTFNFKTLNLTCGASPSAQLSGPLMVEGGTGPAYVTNTTTLQPGGNLLVDNNILVSVTLAGASTPVNGPTNVCAQSPAALLTCNPWSSSCTWNGQPVPSNENANCFTQNYVNAATQTTIMSYPPGDLGGQDPDTYSDSYTGGETVDAFGGIPPIDISSLLVPGTASVGQQQNVTVDLDDEGGVYTGSTLFFTTNCTINGVSGGEVLGTPITTGSSQNQSFPFSTTPGSTISFGYNVSGATNLSNPTGAPAYPVTTNAPVDPTQFQADYVPGTSFATSNCLVHSAELLPNGNQACKVFTLECIPTNGYSLEATPAAGANCPVSSTATEVVQDLFDGPSFSLQNIYTPYGFFREGMGFLMGSETWPGSTLPPASPPGGNCTFDTASNLEALPCPQNLLNSFSGPGGFNGNGETTNPNSEFISVYGVPEDFTIVFVAGEWPDNWVNTDKPQVYFYSQSPNFSKGAWILNSGKLVPLPNASNYVPQPIKSITYGVTSPGSVPSPVSEPISADTVLNNSATTCPTGPLTTTTEPNFAPPPQTLSFSEDGQYVLHYYAQDCAGTQELQFTYLNSTTGWETNFFTYPINVDTTPPTISAITLSPAPNSTAYPGKYKPNTIVTASFTCADAGQGPPITGSGVVLCGLNLYAPETAYNNVKGSAIFSVGGAGNNKSFTVYAVDGAGNITPASVTYSVGSK